MDFETKDLIALSLASLQSINLILWILKQANTLISQSASSINLILWILKLKEQKSYVESQEYKFDPMDFETINSANCFTRLFV